MKPFQTILFGADFSEGSREAFRAACSLAVAGETRIHVVHVIEPNWVPEEPVPYGQAVMGFYDAQTDGGRDETLKRRMRDMYVPSAARRRRVSPEGGGCGGGDPHAWPASSGPT